MTTLNPYSLAGRGIAGPKITRSYDTSRGWQTTYEYEGTERSISAFLPLLRSANRNFTMDLRGPKAVLTITTPDSGDNSVSDKRITYELDSNISQKSLYEHWRTLAFANANQAELIAIKAALQDIKTANPNATTLTDPNTGKSITLSADGREFYKRMLVGQDSFVVSQTVMKVTIIDGRDSELAVAYSNSNCVYTTDQMLSELGLPAASKYFKAAQEAALALNAFYTQGGAAYPYSVYPFPGWLKHAPSMTPIAGDKDATTLEFWLEAWSQYMYNYVA